MVARARVVISDPLIIRACNVPGGSGGVADWANRTARLMVEFAQRIAPVGDPQDAGSRGYRVGTYRASFGVDRGDRGNQHKVIRYVYNDAPHAYFVEYGRDASFSYEVFTWARKGGRWQKRPFGTRGWRGHYILEQTSTYGATLIGL